MKKLSLLSALVIAMIFSLASCKNDSASSSAAPAPAATPAPSASVQSTPVATTPAFTGPATSMTFAQPTFDFGKIMDGEKVEHVFLFENTGSEPLVISNAKGSCGCTVPDWPKDPIKPGATGEIKVVYNSKGKGKVGGKNENKTVTITANTTPAETRIFVKGIVDKEETAG